MRTLVSIGRKGAHSAASAAGMRCAVQLARAPVLVQRSPQRGAWYPPGTPLGDSITCHSWAWRLRKLAIDPAR